MPVTSRPTPYVLPEPGRDGTGLRLVELPVHIGRQHG
jgi:hypothetical protein